MNKIITTALGIAAAAAGLYAFNSQIGDVSKLGKPTIVGKNLCFDYDGNGKIDLVASRSYGNQIYLYTPSEVRLKDLKGKDPEVKNYVLNNDETGRFLEKYLGLLDYLIPLYEKEGKAYLTIAVGCTGGRHRSVTIAESIFEHIRNPDKNVTVTHRDIDQ